MKGIVSIAALMSVMALPVLADSDTGCGAGTILWAGQSGVVPKVLAITTNGSFGNQTFGITTGTLGCSPNGVISSKVRLSMFTGSNLEHLAYDMSVGHGESLNTLADLMKIPASEKAHFFATTQSHYGEIFAPEHQTAGQILAALQGVMRSDTQLSAYAS
ncbi:MAG: DUF3015 family protein [Pseudomonadales bacterium]|nr:DUF3015 family protein [Pseudomonadales bacterium]